jgi:hypothetical protein
VSASTVFVALSGARVDLLAPDWRQIELADVAHGMSMIRRWNSQTRRQIGDAEHSMLVARLAPKAHALAALLHDAHEAYVSDVTTPSLAAMTALAGPGVAPAVDRIKFGLDVAISRAVLAAFGRGGSEFGEADEAEALAREMRYAEVREADARAARIERGMLGQGGAPFDGGGFLPEREPEARGMALAWLDAVRAATIARYPGAAA